jgi:hypothetical protein
MREAGGEKGGVGGQSAEDGLGAVERLLAAEGARPCPCCAVLNAGKDEAACDHVTCIHCGFEYCYLCDAPREPILAHGNHYHAPGCRYRSHCCDRACVGGDPVRAARRARKARGKGGRAGKGADRCVADQTYFEECHACAERGDLCLRPEQRLREQEHEQGRGREQGQGQGQWQGQEQGQRQGQRQGQERGGLSPSPPRRPRRAAPRRRAAAPGEARGEARGAAILDRLRPKIGPRMDPEEALRAFAERDLLAQARMGEGRRGAGGRREGGGRESGVKKGLSGENAALKARIDLFHLRDRMANALKEGQVANAGRNRNRRDMEIEPGPRQALRPRRRPPAKPRAIILDDVFLPVRPVVAGRVAAKAAKAAKDRVARSRLKGVRSPAVGAGGAGGGARSPAAVRAGGAGGGGRAGGNRRKSPGVRAGGGGGGGVQGRRRRDRLDVEEEKWM